jgi:hypothetical protein
MGDGIAMNNTTIEVACTLFVIAVFATLPARRKRQKKKPETRKTEPLTLRWQTSPSTFQPEPQYWALANTLVFNARNGCAWDSLRLDASADETRQSLRQSWGISDRATLLEQLHGVFTGGHRQALQPFVGHYAGLPEAAFKQEVERLREDRELPDEARRESLWQMQAARDNRDGVQSVNFLAWDMVRFIMLCQNGLLLDLIDEREARDFVLLPSLYLQRDYKSWLDCADQFMRARGFWAGGDPAMIPTQEATREVIELAQRDPHSPWKLLAWEMALPHPQWLFVSALYEMQLLAPLSERERGEANEFELLLDNALQKIHLTDLAR